jgi:hypothetical protein
MRTVDATLTAALASGKYKPYAYIHCEVEPGSFEHHEAIYYELTGVKALVQYRKIVHATCMTFTIERGVTIAGTEYGLETSDFFPVTVTEQNGIITMVGHIFNPFLHLNIDGYQTYANILGAIAGEYDKSPVFADYTEDFWNYEFLPEGKYIDVNRPEHFLSYIRQKYLIHAEDGENKVKFFYPALAFDAGDADWTLEPEMEI